MSALTKKKYVIAETLESDVALNDGETIQMIVSSPGSQLFEVEDEFGERSLASLPQKFRKTIWLKRKDFVVCLPIFEGNKVKFEITRILQNQHLKELELATKFPKEFGGGDNLESEIEKSCNDSDGSDNSEDSIPSNVNRRIIEIEESSDSSEDESETESDNESIPELENDSLTVT